MRRMTRPTNFTGPPCRSPEREPGRGGPGENRASSIPARSQARSLGVEWGRKVGERVLGMRTGDGFEPGKANDYLGRYRKRADSLRWQPTGPFRGANPGHGKIAPWTMTGGAQFRAPDFHDPASPEFAEEFDTIRRLGGMGSRVRTPDQSERALFWEDDPWGITPTGHMIRIGVQLLQDRGLDFVDLARAFALIGMTQCDASIFAWDSKCHHDIVRPESAIRVRAPAFRNPDPRVVPEPNWRSYIPTPEFPSYPSGYSAFAAAGAETIALLSGGDDMPFAGRSPDGVPWPELHGVTRRWTGLSQVAEQIGTSRLHGGVHWEIDHAEAVKAGRAIAIQAFRSTFPKRA